MLEEGAEFRRALRAEGKVVVEEDGLAVEQERLTGGGRIVDQLIDERDESLLKTFRRVVPLTVPVRVRNDVQIGEGRGHAAECAWPTRMTQAAQ